ncbi:MAG: FHIPEP family type III secretion protein [Armatimonadota bacterium]
MSKITSRDIKITFFNDENNPGDFLPWILGQRGEQSFLKLSKGEETGFLYVGAGLHPGIHKTLSQLAAKGWKLEGKTEVSFDGIMSPEVNVLFEKNIITLELGQNLLPVVDEANNAPLLGALSIMRHEFAEGTGLLIPSINIKDNLKLKPNEYVLKIKCNPVAKGEIFLDRFMVLAPQEKLDKIKGWVTIDPTFKVSAKWIEEKEKSTAEKLSCLIVFPLNVLLTHIKETIRFNFKNILGLQELRYLVERVYQTHPILAEDFLKDTDKLRKLKIVLGNLLGENVVIKDFISILEAVGEAMEQVTDTNLMTEIVRIHLASQICWQYLDEENKLKVFCFDRAMEKKLIDEVSESAKTQRYYFLAQDKIDEIIIGLKEALMACPEVKALMVPPSLRLFLNNLLGARFPQVAFLSTAEVIAARVEPRIAYEIKAEKENKDTIKKEKDDKKEKKGFWGRKGKKK